MINLALRSEFSFRSVYQKVEDMCNDQSIAVGIADHSNTQGHVRFQVTCKEHGIKPIFGVRVMAVANVDDRPRNPGQFGFEYIVLAKNLTGLQEIHRLVKKAHENFYYRPLVGLLDIWNLSDNVIVIAENFRIPERIDYIGLSQATHKRLLKNHDLPVVALNYNFYPTAEDKLAYQLLLGSRDMDNRTYQQHILSDREWLRLFSRPDAIDNTYLIAEQCNAELLIAEPVRYNGTGNLRQWVDEGLIKRGIEKTPEIIERIEHELSLIEGKDFTDYFMIVGEMINEAKKTMLVGPARGSAAGSLVCYLIGITEVNPLEHELLFERFLDAHRHDMPDVDSDFPDKHRDRVIRQLIRDNGGSDHVCHLGTVAKMRGDSLINHVGKEYDIPFEDTAELKEALIRRPGGDKRVNYCVHDTIETTEIGKQFAEKYPVIRVAARIEGHTTHAGVHAAGILVCNRPVTDYVGVNGKDNSAMIDYREAELLNLLKIDALGLRTLTVLQETAEMAGFDYHDFYKIPLDDEAALELFRNDRLLGVFQFDAGAIKSLCRQIKVQNFDDICAITSLGRPGPIEGGGTRSYVERHNGYEEVTYISSHPKIIEITKPTLGVIVYQEQLMHICRAVGMDWKDVSMFRKVVAKRKGKELLGTYEDTFKRCAKDAGLPDTEANEVWEQMATFGKYGFNKSHAVSYGMVSYMCAWAKAHYPLQFAVANLNNMKSKDSAVRLLRDFVRHEGFEYVPVDPDMSDVNWSVHEGKLLGGLTNIHGLGESKAKKIIENRRAGKVDTPSIIRMLINARTDFDILFPCQHFWSEYYESGNVVTIDQILEAGEYTFIGKINKKKIKDLNTDEQVEKRGARFEKDSLALNIYVEDDTDEIMCRVPRNKFERYAREIIARDDAQAPYEKNWYMFTGKIINASMLFVLLDKITYLGERH